MKCPECGSNWKEEGDVMTCASCGLTRLKSEELDQLVSELLSEPGAEIVSFDGLEGSSDRTKPMSEKEKKRKELRKERRRQSGPYRKKKWKK